MVEFDGSYLNTTDYDLVIVAIVVGSVVISSLVLWWLVARFDLSDKVVRNLLPMRRKKIVGLNYSLTFDDDERLSLYPKKTKSRLPANETDALLGEPIDRTALDAERKRKYEAGIVACMCVYRESETELRLSNRTFQGQTCMTTTLFIMVDGCPTVEDENSVETFLNLKRIWNIDTSKAEHAHGCRIYKGVFDQVPYRVYVKGPECPTGKRQSHIVFFQTLEELIKQKELEKPFGIHMVDGDTGSFDGLSDMAKMFGVMVANPGTAAICSNVLPINHNYCNLLLCEQAFEYSYFFRWNTGGLSLFGSVQTAVGMSVLYDYELLLTAIVPDGLGMTLIEKYCAESTTFFDLAMLDLAEDYGLTLFMQQAGFDSMMCHLSHFRTSVPATWQDFFGQRRRWNTAYLIGTWHLLFVNSPYFMVYKNARWLIWIFDVVQLLCTFFGASSIVSLWVEYLADGIAEINPYYRLHIKDAEYIAFGSVWGVLLLYFIAILDRNNAESLYLLIAASVFGILFSIYYYIMSIIEGTYDIFLFMMASIVPHFFINDYRYWPRLASGAIIYFIFNMGVTAVALYFFLIANIDSTVWGTRSTTTVSSQATAKYHDWIRLQKYGIILFYLSGNISLSYVFVFYNVSDFYILILLLGWQYFLFPASMIEWYRQARMQKYVMPRLYHSDYWPEEEDNGEKMPKSTYENMCACDVVIAEPLEDEGETADVVDRGGKATP